MRLLNIIFSYMATAVVVLITAFLLHNRHTVPFGSWALLALVLVAGPLAFAGGGHIARRHEDWMRRRVARSYGRMKEPQRSQLEGRGVVSADQLCDNRLVYWRLLITWLVRYGIGMGILDAILLIRLA